MTKSVEVRVWDRSAELRYLVLPGAPGTEGLSEEELAELVTRDAMIGVAGKVLGAGLGRKDGVAMDAVPIREIADMDGAAALPRRNGELVFDAAWQARVFGMTVAMSHEARFAWRDFQAQLIAAIAQAERDGKPSTYYERWLHAFESLLVDKGLLAPGALAERTHDFESGHRDDVF